MPCYRVWRARLRVGLKQVDLGIFRSPTEAGMAYDLAAMAALGAHAPVNFIYGEDGVPIQAADRGIRAPHTVPELAIRAPAGDALASGVGGGDGTPPAWQEGAELAKFPGWVPVQMGVGGINPAFLETRLSGLKVKGVV